MSHHRPILRIESSVQKHVQPHNITYVPVPSQDPLVQFISLLLYLLLFYFVELLVKYQGIFSLTMCAFE